MNEYWLTYLGLLLISTIPLIYGPILGPAKGKAGVEPGGLPGGGYNSFLYRMDRSHQNATENLAVFMVPAVLAIILGVNPALLAGLVWAHIGFRLIYLVLYLRKIGAATGGARSMIYAASWLVNLIVIAVVAWQVV